MLNLLTMVTEGKATMQDIELLEEVAYVVKDASLCALGKTAANPVLTTLRYFRDEYVAHVQERKCPSKTCQAMKSYFILAELCKGCGKCARNCPTDAIKGKVKQPYVINQDVCIKCGLCESSCSFDAVVERW
jgi:NADH-quinone oxidoreductase subunit F